VRFRNSGSLLSSNTLLYPYKPLSFVYFVVVFSLHSQEKVISFIYFLYSTDQIFLLLLFSQMLQVRIECCLGSYRAPCSLFLFHTQET